MASNDGRSAPACVTVRGNLRRWILGVGSGHLGFFSVVIRYRRWTRFVKPKNVGSGAN